MAYGTLLTDVVQSSTSNTPPQFNDGNGTQVGTLCRAWVNFNGTGTVAIRSSFNVSSITDNGTGNYTVNFTNAMPDANYAVSGSSGQGGTFLFLNATDVAANTVNSSRIYIRDGGGTFYDLSTVSVTIFR